MQYKNSNLTHVQIITDYFHAYHIVILVREKLANFISFCKNLLKRRTIWIILPELIKNYLCIGQY